MRSGLIDKSDKSRTLRVRRTLGGTPFQTGVFNPRAGECTEFKRFHNQPRANAATQTRFAPAFRRTRAHSRTVPKVVSTSSISRTDLP